MIDESMNYDVNNEEEMNLLEGFEPAPTTLLQALERVGMVARFNVFNEETLKIVAPELAYLAKRLGVTEMQAFLLGVCIENDFNQMTVGDFAQCLDISNAHAISLVNDLTTLVHLRLLSVNEHLGNDTYSVPSHVLKLLARNVDYKAPQVTGLNSDQLLAYANRLIVRTYDKQMTNEELKENILWILEANPECRFVKSLNDLNLNGYSSIFTLIMLCTGISIRGTRYVKVQKTLQYLDDQLEASEMKFSLKEGYNELITKGLVEPYCEDGVAYPNIVTLTRNGRKQLLADVKIAKRRKKEEEQDNGLFENHFLKLIKASGIADKPLFFEPRVDKQVSELGKFFEQDNYNTIVERMKQSNFRSAFTCIFYGGPGTGKTETVYQLARATQRDILLVDVPQIKDKWVGESEKNVKRVFDQYRALTKKSKLTPILLFNEADAIFCKRLTDVRRSTDQMINTMQNIILQEMESLNGILIATTNLADNLDTAFERRFLYKIKFERPSVEAREHIWHAMIPSLNSEQATTLAEKYEFSGGQIENVARKYAINNILYDDKTDTLDSLSSICDNELIEDDSNYRRVGF
ncbi:MAG: ATP-binding protein [Muribaculaceae bacterium]|nr:ATP-binding protein [Muribaculaceae bacterium]